jgi:two-component system chemotaxis response regulator CheB
MIKLLIVDDSALMRRQLSTVFQAEPDFEIRTARNGREAVEENHSFRPDVVTLDINMPEMDGLTALSRIMVERPVAVVMVSSLTEKGALATLEALNLGAVDFVAKPGGTISLSLDAIRATIVSKVRTAARARLKPLLTTKLGGTPPVARAARNPAAKPLPGRGTSGGAGVVVIGVSTGGPRTLECILPNLRPNFPWSILVAQHMPASFTLPFAQRLNGICAMPVVEANRPMTLEPDTIYIAKGGADMQVVLRGGKPTAIPTPENTKFLWHPSVELLGRTVLEQFDAAHVVGVMLTGMGNDGSDSFSNIKKRGGRTIAESKDSAVVFGMPAELIAKGGATVILSAERIAMQINSWVPG